MAALRNFNGLASWKNAENSLQSVNLTMPAVAIAVRNVSGRRRWSKLDEWLALPTDGAESGFLAGAGAPRGSPLTRVMQCG